MLRFIVPVLLIVVPVLSLSIWGLAGLPVALVFDIILIALSIRIVGPNTVRTVEFLGKFNRILRPGFHFIIPFLEWTKSQVLYRRNFPVEVEGVTSDNVTAYIGLNVIYYVDDNLNDTKDGTIFKSVYSIDDARTMMRSTIDEQLRGMIVSFTHKQIFAKREEIGNEIEERLRKRLAGFGYKLDSIQVRDVKLQNTVMEAMNQRTKIAEWFKEAVDMIKATDKSLNAEKVLQFLLDSSRIETLGNIGTEWGSSKVIYLNEDLEGKSWLSKGDKLIAGSDLMK